MIVLFPLHEKDTVQFYFYTYLVHDGVNIYVLIHGTYTKATGSTQRLVLSCNMIFFVLK